VYEELVIHRDTSFLDKVDLSEFFAVIDYGNVRLVYSCEHIDNQLIYEAALAVFEKVLEMNLEVLEYGVDDLGLHLRRYLLIKVELLYDQIEIVHECVVHVLLDVAVQIRWYVEWLIRPLDLLNPNVQHGKFFVDEGFKVVRFLQHIVDAAHQEGEEA